MRATACRQFGALASRCAPAARFARCAMARCRSSAAEIAPRQGCWVQPATGRLNSASPPCNLRIAPPRNPQVAPVQPGCNFDGCRRACGRDAAVACDSTSPPAFRQPRVLRNCEGLTRRTLARCRRGSRRAVPTGAPRSVRAIVGPGDPGTGFDTQCCGQSGGGCRQGPPDRVFRARGNR